MRHPALAILILATAALRPILQPHLPCSDDIGFHLLRLTQLDVLVRQGVFFSRWAPDMAQGYGYPLFNFYAPLSYYAAEFISLLAGNLNLGLRLTLALGMLAAGWMMYRLAREHVQPLAAVVAAVAYMYAPYHAYDIFFRGNLAESFAWWLLPLALWCIGRLASRGGWGWVAATAATYAAIILTHNVFALIFSPLLLAYGLWGLGTRDWGQSVSVLRPSSLVPRPLSLLPLALLLGLLASAFFWFPALAERPFIYSDRLLVPPIFVHWGNFLTLGELFTPPKPFAPTCSTHRPNAQWDWCKFCSLCPPCGWCGTAANATPPASSCWPPSSMAGSPLPVAASCGMWFPCWNMCSFRGACWALSPSPWPC